MIVATEAFHHTFTAVDEVTETWLGKSIYFPKGARLAIDRTRQIRVSAVDLENPSIHHGLPDRRLQFREFNAEMFQKLRASLIEKNSTASQVDFIKIFLSRESFRKWAMKTLVHSSSGYEEPRVFEHPLKEEAFTDMPRSLEKELFSLWSDLTPNIASRPSFWGMLTTNHIFDEVIEPSYLAATPGDSISGKERIERAVSQEDEDMIDDVTRTILRRMSGLAEARGALRSVQANCSFARAWWRESAIREVVEQAGANEEAVALTLHKSQEFWEKVASLLTVKNSRFSDQKVRVAFIAALSNYVDNAKFHDLFLSDGLINDCRKNLGDLSNVYELAIYDTVEIRDFIANEVIEPLV